MINNNWKCSVLRPSFCHQPPLCSCFLLDLVITSQMYMDSGWDYSVFFCFFFWVGSKATAEMSSDLNSVTDLNLSAKIATLQWEGTSARGKWREMKPRDLGAMELLTCFGNASEGTGEEKVISCSSGIFFCRATVCCLVTLLLTRNPQSCGTQLYNDISLLYHLVVIVTSEVGCSHPRTICDMHP